MMLWMVSTVLAGALIAGAALFAEEGVRLLGTPRRWVWLLGMVSATVLPLIYRLLPARPEPTTSRGAVDTDLLEALLRQAPAVEGPAALVDRLPFGAGADPLLIGVWVAAATGMAAALLLTCRRLAAVRARARAVEIAGVPALLTGSTGPMVVGVRRPEVVVPRWIESLPEEEQRLIIRHECEHIRAGDPRLLLAAAVLVAAMPWNLPLWWMRRRLRQAIEVDCDARVLAAGADRRLYGSMLIRTAGRPRPAPLLAPSLVELPSLLERRIIAMTAKSPDHRLARLGAAGTLAALLFTAACELTPRSSAPSPTEPTLADLLDAEESEQPVREGEAAESIGAEPVEVVYISPDGTAANGETLRPTTVRLRRTPEGLDPGSANPVVLVDGERVESIKVVDPDRIESVEVVKGSAAIELYGPEAAEGVVRITTGDAAAPQARWVPVPAEAPAKAAVVEGVRFRYGVAPAGVPSEAARSAEPEAPVAVKAEAYAANPEARAVLLKGGVERAASSASPVKTEQPLILVDGEVVPTMADVSARFEPGQIASISVIKDPEAAMAVYGARARHGAIIINLKK